MEIILILIILVASSSSCQAMFTDQVEGKQKIDKFVVRYPRNVCSTGAVQDCRTDLPAGKFTIHGLWPNEVSEPIKRTFDINLLKGQLLKDLEEHWPGLQNSANTNDYLWYRQWVKHGCYFHLGSGTQVEYFQKGIDLFRTPVIEKALSQLLITGKKYVTVDILKQLKQITNFNPALSCKDSTQGNIKLLVEVTFCLESDLKTLKDCPDKPSCGTEFYVETTALSPPPPPPRAGITEEAVASF
ncbi:ribonuclease S-F11-like [Ziziphus jujuba]|uniref:Ribonuclease S-F11-like n=1 Tax=Ziziphus jujuba TaxID=326968 RepID=A0A386ND27_ZIZJJ|nr:ribonuclease S-F11-like [Ziziphus jujuba]AYE19111.1 S-RNase [Ziziphus jujuba]